MTAYVKFTFAILFIASGVTGYKYFQSKIPNGESVPHPCKANYIWYGVGHIDELGGGDRNQFGEDFKAEGKTWTLALCQKDSDGDGKSNGEELGDPNCVWKEGTYPQRTTGLSHPGVCEPYDSALCKAKNKKLNCEIKMFKCDAINDPGVKNVTIRFPETSVPNNETNYFCMNFELPKDGDYHLIATKPLIDNANVMHHILLFGCDEEVTDTSSAPLSCEMGTGKCRSILGGWSVGSTGNCVHKDVGYRIGQQGYKSVMMQFHWNNPELRSDYTDSSGMVLYYTPNKRLYNAGTVVVGQVYLEIPPGKDKVEVTAVCRSQDTKEKLRGSIHIISGFNHMHYLGREQYIQHYRDGKMLQSITNDPEYNYDRPNEFKYADAIEIKPGDELKTTCVFKSKSRTHTVFQGRGTSDEMCYGFLNFYPLENLTLPYQCVSWKSLPVKLGLELENYGCNPDVFLNFSHPNMKSLHARINDRCLSLSKCLDECKEVVKEIKGHPCLKGDVGEAIRWRVRSTKDIKTLRFFSQIDSCDLEIYKESVFAQAERYAADGDENSGSQLDWKGLSFLSLFSIMILMPI